jgi:hypothetical protein
MGISYHHLNGGAYFYKISLISYEIWNRFHLLGIHHMLTVRMACCRYPDIVVNYFVFYIIECQLLF